MLVEYMLHSVMLKNNATLNAESGVFLATRHRSGSTMPIRTNEDRVSQKTSG